MKKIIIKYSSVFILFLFSATAMAHSGLPVMGKLSGFWHPFTGLDHLLAIFAAGLWMASHNKLEHRLLVPLVFLVIMAVGAYLGSINIAIPMLETGIALSVVLTGLFIMTGFNATTGVLSTISALFALLHGNAHGLEIGTASVTVYFSGFIAATALLMAAGFMSARQLIKQEWLLRSAGLVISLIGAGLLAGS